MFAKLLDRFKTVCAILVVMGVFVVAGSVLTRAAAPGIINYQGRVQLAARITRAAGF